MAADRVNPAHYTRIGVIMKSLQVQIQPNLQPGLDSEKAVNKLRRLASSGCLAARVRVSRGVDERPYINVRFVTDDLKKLWARLRRELRNDAQLACASIVVCEGNRGWDDYSLLHHFDRNERRNRIKQAGSA